MSNESKAVQTTWAERLGQFAAGNPRVECAATRRKFLTRAGAAMAAIPAVAALSSVNSAKAEVSAVAKPLVPLFTSIKAHENNHVAFLLEVLGKNARPKPTFVGLEQPTYYQFVVVAQTLENTGVAAYLGAATSIDDPGYLAAAASIATIEARHSSALNFVLNDPITANIVSGLMSDNNFDQTLTAAQVVTAASGFIKSLNGGPAIGYASKPSPQNDIAILNFALALEFLEADFYNINFNKFLI